MESVGCSNDEMDATEADIVETVALLASEWRHNQAQYVPTSGMVSVWGFGEGLEPRIPNEAAFARVNRTMRNALARIREWYQESITRHAWRPR